MQPALPKKSQAYIPSLTGIRAICVYFIFFYHNNIFTAIENPDGFLLLNQFYTFLTFFFVLSGFVICYKYYSISSLNKKALYNYFVNRFSRVFPILFLLITATFVLQYVYNDDTLPHIIKSLLYNVTLLKGFSTEYNLTGIGPSWSMSVEELFYALSPFIFFFMAKPSFLLRFVLLFYALGVLITFVFIHINFDGFFSDYIFTFYATFFGRAFEFACGIYLAMIVKGKFENKLLKKMGKWTLHLGIVIVISSVATLYFIAQYYNIGHASGVWLGIIVNNIFMPVGITFIFYSLIFHKSYLQIFLSSTLMVALGNATYSFYLLHTSFFLTWETKYIGRNIFISFLVMIIFSYFFHKIIEQPLANYLRKKLHAE
jgi:peptidoglycan/LPS O-acetylase OafA/YrhL